ncbi:pirin family protein [Sulfurivermis fontis]|uniref:pirin family protein n=1 Tax=Sulfurivermis fontis TaxID=1972068 RepID=UPI000FDB5338|nr:pirin family protein [Sulfurivermis fontis]
MPLRPRSVQQVIHGQETADGDGVRLTRVIGGPALPLLDPFLLLDDFRSDDPDDYIGGFPPHPHRGFETVTYLLHGRLRHGDNAGHSGVIEHGGVQWMTAGRGIVHSEMPEQEEGLLAGFQLWVNLPAAHKMMAPRYQEFGVTNIPVETRDGGVTVKVVAGTTSGGTTGPVRELITPVSYFDVTLPAGARFAEPVDAERNAFVYVFDGAVRIDGRRIETYALAQLGAGDAVEIEAESDSRLLLVSGAPLREPVARGGPFVMNTEAELRQAYNDYRAGNF